MKLRDIQNNKDYELKEDEKEFIEELYDRLLYKKHFTYKNSSYILDFLLKYNIEIYDETEDLTIHEEVIQKNEVDNYLNDYTTNITFENREISENIMMCDIFRDEALLPTFHLYFKVIYGYYKTSYNNYYYSYQIKHFRFQ